MTEIELLLNNIRNLSKSDRIKSYVRRIRTIVDNMNNQITELTQQITELNNENVGLNSYITNKLRRNEKKKARKLKGKRRNKRLRLDLNEYIDEELYDDENELMNELSINNPPISTHIEIDAKNKISEKKQKQNDGYNKKAVFSMFRLYKITETQYIPIKQSVFEKFEEKNKRYIKLKNVSTHKFIINRNNLLHYLIASDNDYKKFINSKDIPRLFTFIEYNENYLSGHPKNYIFNCDQIASVLLPYIWEQLSFEVRIKLINFIKIVVLHKLTNEGITNEHRFFIIYDNYGNLNYYLVDRNIHFNTNVKFNFMEENLFCDSLLTFEHYTETIVDQKTKKERKIKHLVLDSINNTIKEATSTYIDKIEHCFNNDDNNLKFKHNNSDVITIKNDDNRKIEFNYKFNFNEKINSNNINKLFDDLRVYNCFDIINGEIRRVINETDSDLNDPKYTNKIMAHFVMDFTKENLDRINLNDLISIIRPDTVIVTVPR